MNVRTNVSVTLANICIPTANVFLAIHLLKKVQNDSTYLEPLRSNADIPPLLLLLVYVQPEELEALHSHTFRVKTFKKAKHCGACQQTISQDGLICRGQSPVFRNSDLQMYSRTRGRHSWVSGDYGGQAVPDQRGNRGNILPERMVKDCILSTDQQRTTPVIAKTIVRLFSSMGNSEHTVSPYLRLHSGSP